MGKIPDNAVAIGNFDGFHLGHQKIVKNTLGIAGKFSLGNVLLTFKPNPRIFFGAEDKLIFTDAEKSSVLNSTGISNIEYIDFKEVFNMTGSEFIDKYLIKKWSMKYLIVGENFRLGKGRTWDITRISEYGKIKNFEVNIVSSEFLGSEKISSSMIRSLLREGDLGKAGKMLGRDYSLIGTIEKGNRIGRKLGFPTINLFSENCLLPDGVYMTKVEMKGRVLDGATYIGTNSSLSKGKKIETHIFNFNETVYGQKVVVSFLKYIREGISFQRDEDLISQIKKDIEYIKVDFKNEV